MKTIEKGFLLKLYLGVSIITMICIWNASRNNLNYNIVNNNDKVIVMNER